MLKCCTEKIIPKYKEQNWMKNLNYLIDPILCQIFRNIFFTTARGIKRGEKNQLFRYTSTKFRIELHPKSKPGTTSNF